MNTSRLIADLYIFTHAMFLRAELGDKQMVVGSGNKNIRILPTAIFK